MAAMVNIIRDERSRSAHTTGTSSSRPSTHNANLEAVEDGTNNSSCLSVLCCCCASTPASPARGPNNRKPPYSKLNNVVMHGEEDEEDNTGRSSESNYSGHAPGGQFEAIPEDEEELSHAEMNVISGTHRVARFSFLGVIFYY
jgi:hypothetical protein